MNCIIQSLKNIAGGLINVMVKGMTNANDEMILTFITFGNFKNLLCISCNLNRS